MGYEPIRSDDEARARRRGSAAMVGVFGLVMGFAVLARDAPARFWAPLAALVGAGGGSSFAASVALSQPYDKNILCYLADVDVTGWSGDHATARVAVSYTPSDSDGLWIWSEAADVTAAAPSAQITFCRLRLNAAHDVRVYVRSGARTHLVHETTISTGSLGFDELDVGPFAEVTGSKPSFPLVTVQHIVGDETSTKWFGLLSLDQEGYVVWYHAMPTNRTLYSVFQQSTKTRNMVIMREAMDYEEGNYTNSYLLEITPVGEMRVQYENACDGDPLGFTQFNHEMKLDGNSSKAITLAYNVRDTFGNYDSLEPLNPKLAATWQSEHGDDTPVSYVGDQLVRWDRATNEVETVYDLFDYVDPVSNAYLSSSYGWVDLECKDERKSRGIEWSHGSSAAVGMDGDYLITLRNLQMLLSMEADGSGARWALASDSSAVGDGGAFDVYRFDAEGSKFWEPHAVVATAKDEFFLVDDGKSRPNCTGATTTCFSRAVGYRLDHAKKQASLFWEFEFPLRKGAGIANEEAEDLFNFDGGYVAKLDRDRGNESYIVAFTAVVVDDDATTGHPAFVFEVDAAGDAVSKIRLPRVPTTHKSGSYRAEATTSINGELFTRPW